MNVLGIYITAAKTRHYVYQVKLHYTCSYAPDLIVRSAFLSGKFQINTGSQSHFVCAGSVITLTVVYVLGFPLLISLTCIIWVVRVITVFGGTNAIIIVNITGKSTKMVHYVIDAKVITKSCIFTGVTSS